MIELTGEPKKNLEKVAGEILAEYLKSRQKHSPLNSAHEGLAIIWEEFEELKELVWLRSRDSLVLEAMREEAIQVAAMSLAFALEVPCPRDLLK